MNWPNRITILRVIMIPVIVILLQFEAAACQTAALAVFIVAALTDWLDGYIARKSRDVTNLGKFLDPVADKLLVLSTMITLCGMDRFPAWVCVVVLVRELSVDGLRLVAVEQGRFIAAGKLGKIKTMLQMLSVVVVMMRNVPFGAFPMDQILVYSAVAMAIWSGVDYFVRNGEVLRQSGSRAK